MSVTNQVRNELAAYVSHTDPTQGWDSNDGYDELEYDDLQDEINDHFVIAAIEYERRLENAGMVRSVYYFEPMLNALRDGDNTAIIKMIKTIAGFGPFLTANYPEITQIIIDNVGTISSQID